MASLSVMVAISSPAFGGPIASFGWFDYRGTDRATPQSPIGPDHYRNPILNGFYPDPSLLRVGGDFYLVTSTFGYFPGLPVFHSRDLIHWSQIGNAIDRPGQLDFRGIGLSEGVFAPSLAYHAGLFYLVNTCVNCGGNYVITARNPAGPWSDPVWIKDVGGIDPSLYIAPDGKAWLLNNDAPEGGSRYDGHRAIWIRRFDLATLKTSGAATMIVDGGVDIATKPIWVEGPKLFTHDGRYYLIAAEGGTAMGHSETVYRADRPEGPWTAFPKPILTQRDLDPGRPDPVTSAGHATIVDTPSGEWWSSFLAVRPYRGDEYNTGRETFLLPVRWVDGWPIITAPGQAIPSVIRRPALPATPPPPVPTSGDFTVHDDFTGSRLPLDWMTIRIPSDRWWRLADGALQIAARPDAIGTRGQPSALLRRQQHPYATASTIVRFAAPVEGSRAGLVAYQNEEHYYFVGIVNRGGRRMVEVDRRADASDPRDGVVIASAPAPATGSVRLRIVARGDAYDFAFADEKGRWMPLVTGADGGVLSTKRAGGFVGASFGLYAYSPR
ncbi:MAG: glycoside hydrolase family 43 protein [Sphingomonas sp.]|uniref:glycoside hydrolase family 43 protein n=1 Tax=Sphingomonas sp. TaxID=28214 RepID=UPI001ACE6095|nr:glycoside hydrolase family 43 protein [Sphingomonas sp.]MBN8807855.1 glycoside hydrolase family 43 protein [Sphingomonas sp.]